MVSFIDNTVIHRNEIEAAHRNYFAMIICCKGYTSFSVCLCHNALNTKINLKCIYKPSSYLAVEQICLCYKNQSVNSE